MADVPHRHQNPTAIGRPLDPGRSGAFSARATASANERAFARLRAEYGDRVFNYLVFHLPTRQDAEDLYQDVFGITIWQRIEEVANLENPRSWVFAIAHNKMCSYWRQRKSRQTNLQARLQALQPAIRHTRPGQPLHGTDALEPEGDEPLGIVGGAVGYIPDIADAVVAEDDRARIKHALEQLSPRQRQCVSLYSYLDLTYDEIAETLGLSLGSVRRYVFEGRERLRTALGDLRATTRVPPVPPCPQHAEEA